MYIFMKPYILLLLFACCLFSCSEDEIESYYGGQYLYFSQLKDAEEDENAIRVSFNNYPLDNELTVKISLGLVGDPFTKDAPYKIGVVKEKPQLCLKIIVSLRILCLKQILLRIIWS